MLGKLKKVSLREIWKNEAYDFTPWLAENIDQLAEAIGIELEFIDKEVSVGSYSADILAKDTGTDKFVVIENQLEKTNHDHLGKCVTYASVLDASAIIWIASKFTDEHKKALDWLNDHTSDEIGFYGLQIELWKIDHSQPAIRFNVISQPNEVVRQVSQRKNQTELSQTRKTQLEFWTMFRNKLSKKKQIRSLQSPRPQYWFDIALGKLVLFYLTHLIQKKMNLVFEYTSKIIKLMSGYPILNQKRILSKMKLVKSYNGIQTLIIAIKLLV